MQNKKNKVIISISKDNILKAWNVLMLYNSEYHILGSRKTEYSANSFAVEFANKFRVEYVELQYYVPVKKEKTIFDINENKT
jgi:hypothetical protein